MLSHGDEMGRTQRGNNNAYCQDNELTWLHWQSDTDHRELQDFVHRIFSLRRNLGFGHTQEGAWVSAHGRTMTAVDLERQSSLPFGWLRHHDDCDSLTVFNGDARAHLFELPETEELKSWYLAINTTAPGDRHLRGQAVRVPARSVLLLIAQH